jgi:DNA polymerase
VSAQEREHDFENVRREALECRSCDLWRDATQTVFGEGPVTAALMLMGEVPGDREDLEGHVFDGLVRDLSKIAAEL